MTYSQSDTKLNRVQYTLEETGLRIVCKRLFSKKEKFVPFENMGTEIISEKEPKWAWLIWAMVCLVFAAIVFIERLCGAKVGDTGELFYLVIGAILLTVYFIKRKNILILSQETKEYEIEFSVPFFRKERVHQFIQLVLQKKEEYLEQHYPAVKGLSTLETMFCATAGVHPEDGLFLKKLTQRGIKPLVLSEETNGEKYFAISSITTEKKSRKIIAEQQDKLILEGKFIYISDFSEKDYMLALVTTTSDPYQIMRYTGTNGCNYNIETEDIIQKYKQWSAQFGIRIIAIAPDFCECEIMDKNIDYKKLAEEVYEFCPDSVDQGTGTVKKLENEIRRSGRIFTWWD